MDACRQAKLVHSSLYFCETLELSGGHPNRIQSLLIRGQAQ